MERPAFETSSFVHDGRRLVYDLYDGAHPAPERDERPLLVYMHGLLIDSDVNRGVAGALQAAGHRVALLDLLGHGRSDKPTHAAEYRIDTYADQVVGLLDHLGEERAVLGGMSLGANVSLFAASRYPARVQGLVLEMPVLEWAVPSAALLFSPMLLLAHYGRGVMSPLAGLLRRVPPSPWRALDSLVHMVALPPEVMAAVLHGVLVGPVAPTVDERERIEAPTLVLAHRNDLLHPFDDAVNLAEQLPHGRLVRARSPLELRLRPDRLTDCVSSFLAELAAPVEEHRVG